VREPELDIASRDRLVRRLIELAVPHDARVMVNGSIDDARRLGCAGAHWPARLLNAAASRPRDLLVAASCHTHADVMRASALDLDWIVLGPVCETPTHMDAEPLGWDGFQAARSDTRVPVFALGGLHPADLTKALASGAHGIAMRRHAWPA
jgi:8-oxo-dGTP diphosphatase